MASSRAARPLGQRPALLILAAWAFAALLMLLLLRGSIAAFSFRDPDDAMRLLQVRDWIGGQGWFDVSQHRVNPPHGGPMHWSRIVDMPIAALILLLRPILGGAQAEWIACIAVPLLLLLALAFVLFHAARRLSDAPAALLTVALLLTTPTILVQFTPLRIDHHGWQILMAALALLGLTDPRPARGGAIAGLAIAIWLQISSEGLPYAALFGGAIALWQMIDRDRAPALRSYALVLGIGSALFLLLLRGPAAFEAHCDALSAPYLWPLLLFAFAIPIAMALLGDGTPLRRAGAPALAGLAAAALFAVTGHTCLVEGPFQMLGPIAYRYWYLQVMEGRPIWDQGLLMGGIILLPAIAGLIATLAAARAAATPADRLCWLIAALLLLGATMIAIAIMRAMSVAHLFALPGIAWMLRRLFARVQRSTRPLIRIAGSVGLIALSPVGLSALWIAIIPAEPDQPTRDKDDCRTAAALAPLANLSRATLLAPLDMGPDILIHTPHAVVGTAHHRNAAGITAVIRTFMAPPVVARAIVGATDARYIVTCGSLNEYAGYAKESPKGLAAALSHGKVPVWLHPVPATGPIRIYRVGVKDSATPFMQ